MAGSNLNPSTRRSNDTAAAGSMGNGLQNASINDRPKFKPQNNNSSIKSNIYYDKSETKSDSKFTSKSSLFNSTDLLESTSQNRESPQLKAQQKVASSAQEVNFEESKGSCSRIESSDGKPKDPNVETWESAKGDVKLSKTTDNYEFEHNRLAPILNRPPPPPMRKFKSHRSTPNLFSTASLNKERLSATTPSNFPLESDIKRAVKLATVNTDCSSPEKLSNKLLDAFKKVYAAKQLSDGGKKKHATKLLVNDKPACDGSRSKENDFNFNGSKKIAKPLNANVFEQENSHPLFDSISGECGTIDKLSRPSWKDFSLKTLPADNADQISSLPDFPIKAVKNTTSVHQKKSKQQSCENWNSETCFDLNPVNDSQLPKNTENLPNKTKPECIDKASQTIFTNNKTSDVFHQFTQTDTNRPDTSPCSEDSKIQEHKNHISQKNCEEFVRNEVTSQNEECCENSKNQTNFANKYVAMRVPGGGTKSKKNKRSHCIGIFLNRSTSNPEIRVLKNFNNLNKDHEELSMPLAYNCTTKTEQCETAYEITDTTPKPSVPLSLKIPAHDSELNASDCNGTKPHQCQYGNGKCLDKKIVNISAVSSTKTDCSSARMHAKHTKNETRLSSRGRLVADEKEAKAEALTCKQPLVLGSFADASVTVGYNRNDNEATARKYSLDHQRNQISAAPSSNGKQFEEIPVVCCNVENKDQEKMEQTPRTNLHKLSVEERSMLSSNKKKEAHFISFPSTSKKLPTYRSAVKQSDIIEADDFLYIIVPRGQGT